MYFYLLLSISLYLLTEKSVQLVWDYEECSFQELHLIQQYQKGLLK